MSLKSIIAHIIVIAFLPALFEFYNHQLIYLDYQMFMKIGHNILTVLFLLFGLVFIQYFSRDFLKKQIQYVRILHAIITSYLILVSLSLWVFNTIQNQVKLNPEMYVDYPITWLDFFTQPAVVADTMIRLAMLSIASIVTMTYVAKKAEENQNDGAIDN